MTGEYRKQISERKRTKLTGRGKGHTFIQLPHYMLKSSQFRAMGGSALKLLMFLADQYNGKNNGDLSATKDMVEGTGVCAPSKVHTLLLELEAAGFIVKTRHGTKKLCNLYALTWCSIDECDGKSLEIASGPPRNDWKKTESVAPSGVLTGPLREPKAA